MQRLREPPVKAALQKLYDSAVQKEDLFWTEDNVVPRQGPQCQAPGIETCRDFRESPIGPEMGSVTILANGFLAHVQRGDCLGSLKTRYSRGMLSDT